MGLFNFKKKKDIPFPSKPAEKQPGQDTEVADFDKLLSDVPPPPLDLKMGSNSLPGAVPGQDLASDLGLSEPASIPAEPAQLPAAQIPPLQKKEQKQVPVSKQESAKPGLPKFNLEPKPAMQSKPEQQETQKGFELPDFDDKEMKELEEMKISEAPPVEKKFEPGPKIDYPKPTRPVMVADEKFFDVRSYLNTKDDINSIQNLAGDIEGLLNKYVGTTKAKNDKYHALANALNVIQEKLMLIDNKLFEHN